MIDPEPSKRPSLNSIISKFMNRRLPKSASPNHPPFAGLSFTEDH